MYYYFFLLDTYVICISYKSFLFSLLYIMSIKLVIDLILNIYIYICVCFAILNMYKYIFFIYKLRHKRFFNEYALCSLNPPLKISSNNKNILPLLPY